MGLIKVVTDMELGLEVDMMHKPKTRYGARGIVFDDKKNIALFYRSDKNEYKLPGGEVSNGVDPKSSFIESALNETGCDVDVVYDIGTIEEWKTHDNFKQESKVYLAKVLKNHHTLNLTAKEKKAGYKVIWVPLKEAIKIISDCYDNIKENDTDSVYSIKFMVVRDLEILKYYKINKNIIKFGKNVQSFVLSK